MESETDEHTIGDGLTITVGGSEPWRVGVPPPFCAADLSGVPACVPRAGNWGGCWLVMLPCSPWEKPALLGGRGLLRMSLRVEVDEEGVAAGDWFASLDPDGDAAPSLDSLFFLEDLLESLPRDWNCVGNASLAGNSRTSEGNAGGGQRGRRAGGRGADRESRKVRWTYDYSRQPLQLGGRKLGGSRLWVFTEPSGGGVVVRR